MNARNSQLEVTKAVGFAENSHHDARCDYLDGHIEVAQYMAVAEALARVRAIAASGTRIQESP